MVWKKISEPYYKVKLFLIFMVKPNLKFFKLHMITKWHNSLYVENWKIKYLFFFSREYFKGLIIGVCVLRKLSYEVNTPYTVDSFTIQCRLKQ
jgi:hypothetical protein